MLSGDFYERVHVRFPGNPQRLYGHQSSTELQNLTEEQCEQLIAISEAKTANN